MQDTPSHPLAQLAAALVKAQAAFEPITKNRDGQKGNRSFRYADLEELIRATRPALTANGLAIMQPIRTRPDGGQELVTRLIHESGEMDESTIRLSGEYPDIQIYGATIKYLRRYAYEAVLCISADDDLDNGEGDAPETGSSQPQRQAKQTPRDTPSTCNPEWFAQQLPGWTAAVAKGRTTPERIVSLVESRSPLTDEQRATILALIKPTDEGAHA